MVNRRKKKTLFIDLAVLMVAKIAKKRKQLLAPASLS